MSDVSKNISALSFEEAISELDLIVKSIESGQKSLESSINDFERGMLLKQHCQQKLQEARLKIEKITKSSNGDIAIQEIEL